jgi:hypothetical protein
LRPRDDRSDDDDDADTDADVDNSKRRLRSTRTRVQKRRRERSQSDDDDDEADSWMVGDGDDEEEQEEAPEDGRRMSYAALLFENEVADNDDDEDSDSFDDEDSDVPQRAPARLSANAVLVADDARQLLANSLKTPAERLTEQARRQEERRQRMDRRMRGDLVSESDSGSGDDHFETPLFQVMNDNITKLLPSQIDAVGAEDCRAMYDLLRGGWPALRELLQRETFHGTLPPFLARNVQHKLMQLFSRRQMGSDRRTYLPLLAIDESRRDTLLRAHLAGAVSVSAMTSAEAEYVRRAHRAFARHGEVDAESGRVSIPKFSDPATYAALRRSKAMQLDFRRMACDCCQEWINSKSKRAALISLRAIVTLAPNVAGCRGNFDDVEERFESDEDEGDADASDDEFTVPVACCARNSHSLFVCNDCGDRQETAVQLITFLRQWTSCGQLRSIGLLPSQVRKLCRIAAAVLLTLVDLVHSALRQEMSAVSRLDTNNLGREEEGAEEVQLHYGSSSSESK